MVSRGRYVTAQTLETKKVEIAARKLGVCAEESREVTDSGVGFAEELMRKLGEAAAWFLDDAFLHGDGTRTREHPIDSRRR